MKKIHLLAAVLVLFIVSPLRAEMPEEFWRGKVIFIDQYKQRISVFLDGVPVPDRPPMPTITGDAEFPTPQGVYWVEKKDSKYWSKQYETWMPFSLFFLWNKKAKMAIHEGKVPATEEETSKKATHGCPHVLPKDAEWLFNWAEEKTTKVVVYGDRSQN